MHRSLRWVHSDTLNFDFINVRYADVSFVIGGLTDILRNPNHWDADVRIRDQFKPRGTN